MRRENPVPNTGLTLHSTRLIAAEKSLSMQFVYYVLLLLLGISGAYGCFYTAFSISVTWWVVILSAVLFSAAFTALFLVRPYRVVLTALAVISLLAVLFMRDGVIYLKDALVQGFARTINTVIEAYNAKVDYSLVTLTVQPAKHSERVFYNTAFAVLVLFLLTLLMAWLLIRRKKSFLCILITLPFPGAGLVFTILPKYTAAGVLLIFWAFLLLQAYQHRRTKAESKRRGSHRKIVRGRFYGEGNLSAHPAAFVLLPVLAACLMLVAIMFPKQSFQRAEFVKDLRSTLLNTWNMATTFRAGDKSQVYLQMTGNISFSGKTVLRVKSTEETGEYLKGYVGSVYTGYSWEALSNEDEHELREIVREWKVQNYPYLFGKYFWPFSADPTEGEYELTIQNVGSDTQCIYTPYGLISQPNDLDDIEFVSDGYLRSYNDMEEYNLRSFGLDENMVESMQDSYFDGLWDTEEGLSQYQAAFLQSAQEYTNFVYAHYLQLPEELDDELDAYREEHGLDTDNYSSTYQFVRAVIGQVQSENTYTLSPGLTPLGTDFVEYFLFENHQGYCVHFASAAVALLRSAGIPARYAEGYTVSAGDFTSNDGWAEIPDSRAHAWVELYLSGFGWVPVEATPGAQGGVTDPEATAPISPSATEVPAQNTPGQSEATPMPSKAPNGEETPGGLQTSSGSSGSSQEGQTGGDSSSGSGKSGGEGLSGEVFRTLLRILAVVLAVVLLPALLYINRKLRIMNREKRFAQTELNKAALAVYEYLLKLLPYAKSAQNYYTGIPEELYDTVMKARFSQHTLTESELRKLLGYARDLADRAGKEASHIHWFIAKYVRALF